MLTGVGYNTELIAGMKNIEVLWACQADSTSVLESSASAFFASRHRQQGSKDAYPGARFHRL
jgi:hypothetical protein